MIQCVGCRLGEHLAEVDAFVFENAMDVPSNALFRLAADVYQTRVKPTLGSTAPEWSWQSIENHYHGCRNDPYLTLVSKCRQLRGIREMMRDTLREDFEKWEGGAVPLLQEYLKACRMEREHINLLDKEHKDMLRLLATRRASRQPTSKDDRGTASKPETTPTRDPAAPDMSSDALSEATSDQRPGTHLDAECVKEALNGVLFNHIEPCVSMSHSLQPTLTDLLTYANTADVIDRSRHRQLLSFQDASSSARCFCRSRSGCACHVPLDREMCERLAEETPGGRNYFENADMVRDAVLQLLNLPRGPIQKRRSYPPHSIFGFKRRTTHSGSSPRSASS